MMYYAFNEFYYTINVVKIIMNKNKNGLMIVYNTIIVFEYV